MRSDHRVLAALVLGATVGFVACFDPLFEDTQTGAVAICCHDLRGGLGAVGVCQRSGSVCLEKPDCLLPAFACSGDFCSTNPECSAAGGGSGSDAGSAGGGSGGGGGGTGTGGGGFSQDAGTSDAGSASDGGVDAGPSDAGAPADAGTPLDAGTPDAGRVSYEFCCVNTAIGTCACPASGCLHPTFTVCLNGSCVTSGGCP